MSSPDHSLGRGLPEGMMPGCYVQVSDSSSEWDGLIGILEEFLDEDLEQTDSFMEGGFLHVFFPQTRKGQEMRGLVGVNDFLDSVSASLRETRGRQVFSPEFLEVIDVDEIS